MSTLHGLYNNNYDAIYPAHGPVIVGQHATRQWIQSYIENREKRITQCVDALHKLTEQGEPYPTCMDIVKVVYSDVDESLHLAAAQNTTLVLRMLVDHKKAIIVSKGSSTTSTSSSSSTTSPLSSSSPSSSSEHSHAAGCKDCDAAEKGTFDSILFLLTNMFEVYGYVFGYLTLPHCIHCSSHNLFFLSLTYNTSSLLTVFSTLLPFLQL